MAATWQITINVIDLASKRIRVTAIRTDGADVRSYWCATIVNPDDLAGVRADVLTVLQSLHTAAMDKQTAADSLLAGWETNLKTAMDAWEVNP